MTISASKNAFSASMESFTSHARRSHSSNASRVAASPRQRHACSPECSTSYPEWSRPPYHFGWRTFARRACRLAYTERNAARENASVQYFWFAASLTTMPPPKNGTVFRIGHFGSIRMQSMSVIAAHKHRFRNGAVIIFPREAKRGIHALKRIAQHSWTRALPVFDPTSSLSKQQYTDTSRSFSTAKNASKRNKGTPNHRVWALKGILRPRPTAGAFGDSPRTYREKLPGQQKLPAQKQRIHQARRA